MSCKSLPISCARIVSGRLRGTCSVVITACVTEGCHGMCYSRCCLCGTRAVVPSGVKIVLKVGKVVMVLT